MVKKFFDFNKDGVVDKDDFNHLILRYEIIVAGGVLLMVLPVLNTMGYISVDSNFFWVLCGLMLVAEGMVEIKYERKKRK
tara:strand:+ start:1910 stop:2149 length:240 start_codon:yes stop_codon:yes gene_type:complete